MTNQRKKIILNEILFWKQNKLLPEHYCDFLSTLYTEGEDYEEQEDLSRKQAVLAAEKRRRLLIFTGLFILAIAILFVLFTVNTLIWLFVAFVGLVAFAMLIVAIRLAKKQSLLAPFIHIVAALLILGLSVKVSIAYFAGNSVVLYGLLIGNSLLWLFSGMMLRLVYFTISGALALAVIIGFSIYYYM